MEENRYGQVAIAEALSEEQGQLVEGIVARLRDIAGVSGVALLSPRNPYLTPTLCVIVPHCSGGFTGSIIVAEPGVKAEVESIIMEMMPAGGAFGYSVLTSFAAMTLAGKAQLRRDQLVTLWPRASE